MVSPLGNSDQMLVRLGTSQVSTLQWSRDGKEVVYSDSVRPGGGIFAFSLETVKSRRLTSPTDATSDLHPAISPDGKMLAFGRKNEAERREDIWLMPVSGGPARRLAEAYPYLQGITFTRAGDEVLFASSMKGSKYIYRVPVSGGESPVKAVQVPDAQEP